MSDLVQTETPAETHVIETPSEERPFGVYVYRIEAIVQHPSAENLTLVTLSGHPEQLVANKLDDGAFRYAANDLALLLPVGAVLPQWLLADMDALRTNSKGKIVGTLGGNKGNRIVPRVFADTPSNGMLRRVATKQANGPGFITFYVTNYEGTERAVREGDNVADFLGVTQHVG